MTSEQGGPARQRYQPTRSILLAGVGGQGTITSANLLATALVFHGYDVKTSEVHGMAQRGGSVVSMVRYGTSVASPLVGLGEAEALVSSELLETLRYLQFLAPGGTVICSRSRVDPLPVLQGAAVYPEDVERRIAELVPEAVFVDAAAMAAGAGDSRAAGTVLLGTLSPLLPVGEGEWLKAIEKLVPRKALEANLGAFMAGRKI